MFTEDVMFATGIDAIPIRYVQSITCQITVDQTIIFR